MREYISFYIEPLLMLIIGLIFLIKPPKEIGCFGYRTIMSTKSQETWDTAHKLIGLLLLIFGLLIIIITLYVIKCNPYIYLLDNLQIKLMIIQGAILLGSIVMTEILLWIRFDREGNCRKK